MAEIVLGIGTSHAPQLSTPHEQWRLHAERDQRDQVLWFQGRRFAFEELVEERAGEGIHDKVSDDIWQAKYQACEQAIHTLGEALAKANPDVMVVIGDDQRELFLEENTPALALYGGDRLVSFPREKSKLHPALWPAQWAMAGDAPVSHPCAASLGRHLASELVKNEFDVAYCADQPEGRSLGHAFNFVFNRLLAGRRELEPLFAPVFVNTYYPPNRPTPKRVFRFGQALGNALRSWDEPARVCVIASGGLSHFVVDEALDQRVLEGIKHRDVTALEELPVDWLVSGSAEILNWVTAAGVLESQVMEMVDYVPVYRTEAGTGCGMAFARWS
ncbi:MAG: DODA-type extradiol aromatic ring-opening family dioxygenase [Acidimicrobiales bacterium]